MLGLLASFAGADPAQGPVDGSFESGGAGWTIADARIVNVGTGAFHGTHALEIDPGGSAALKRSTLSALFATTPGQEYRLVFAYQAGFATGTPRLAVLLDGTGPQNVAATTFFFDPGVTRTVPDRAAWQEQSVSFFADGSSTLVQIGPYSRWNQGIGWGRIWIDHVRLEPLGRQETLGRDVLVRATLPSSVKVGEEVELTVGTTGRHHNQYSGGVFDIRPLEFTGTFQLTCDDPAAVLPPSVGFGDQTQRVVKVRLATPGIRRFRLRLGSFEVLSNPTYVALAPFPRQPYWGDIHVHTELGHSDWPGGTGEQNYTVARDFADLDFAALSEHYSSNAAAWMDRLVPPTQAFHAPGRFVTFIATETYTYQGHNNFYLRGKDPFEMFDGRNQFGNRDSQVQNLRARDVRFLTIPHHFMLLDPVDWRETDRGALRLAEIYSVHGSSEEAGVWWQHPDHVCNSYSDTKGTKGHDFRTALARGHRVGVVACSDSHAVQPGLAGLTCVRAPELTRPALWDALYRRDCYATSGERILLDLRVASAHMGQNLFLAPGAAIEARVEVHGVDVIDAIELVRDGLIVRSAFPGTLDANVTFPLGSFSGQPTVLYARVRQRNEHRAWSSPIWIDPQSKANLTLEPKDLSFDHASGALTVGANNYGDRDANATLRLFSSAGEPSFGGEGWLGGLTQPTLVVRVEPVNIRRARLKATLYTPYAFNRSFVYSGQVRVWNAAAYRVVADPRRILSDDRAGTIAWSDLCGYRYKGAESKAGQLEDFELLVDTTSATTVDLLPRVDGAPLAQVRVGSTLHAAPLVVSVPLGRIALTPPLAEVGVSLRARGGRQEVTFPGLPPGVTYVAVLDPEDLVAESDEDDDGTALLVPSSPPPYDHWSDYLGISAGKGPLPAPPAGPGAPVSFDPCDLPPPPTDGLPAGCEGEQP